MSTPEHGVRHELDNGGRTLVTYAAGERGRPLVVVHHGTPSPGILAPRWVADAESHGLRVVGYSRPGYDTSERAPGRAVADAATDAAAIADDEGADSFVTWGFSGGGPHALACAALLPDRIRRAASIAGVAPFEAEGLDWLDGMGEDNVTEFGATEAGEATLRALLVPIAAGMTEGGVEDMIEEMASLLPPVDVAAIRRGWGEWLHRTDVIGLGWGVDGWVDDDLAFAKPWGFDPGEISVPVLVTQGSEDLMVPAAHGEWLGRHIPTATIRRSPGQGHLSLLDNLADVYDWLLAD